MLVVRAIFLVARGLRAVDLSDPEDDLKNVNVVLLCSLMYFDLLFQNNYSAFPKNIDLTEFSAYECSNIGLMSELRYLFLS